MNEETVTLYVRLPKSVKEELDRRAKNEGRTLAGMTTRLIRHALACQTIAVKDEY